MLEPAPRCGGQKSGRQQGRKLLADVVDSIFKRVRTPLLECQANLVVWLKDWQGELPHLLDRRHDEIAGQQPLGLELVRVAWHAVVRVECPGSQYVDQLFVHRPGGQGSSGGRGFCRAADNATTGRGYAKWRAVQADLLDLWQPLHLSL